MRSRNQRFSFPKPVMLTRGLSRLLCLFLLLTAGGPSAQSQAPAPQILLRTGHGARVSDAVFSPDGQTLATVGDDGAVNLWEARTGERRGQWQPAQVYANQIAFSPQGNLLAVGDVSGTVTLLNVPDGTVVRSLRPDPNSQPGLSIFAWFPDGKSLAIARRTGPAALWDVATATVRTVLPPETAAATAFAFSADGRVVVTRFDAPLRPRPGLGTTGTPKSPLAWDTHTGAPATSPMSPALPSDLAGLTPLADGPHGRLALGDEERQDVTLQGRVIPGRRILSTTPVFFDPVTGKEVRGAKVTGPLTDMQWSQDGGRAAAANSAHLLVFDPATGATVLSISTGQFTDAVALSPNGALVTAGEDDGTVAVYALPQSGVLMTPEAEAQPLWRAPGRTTQVQALAVSPDGRQLLSAHADGTLALWDLHTGALIRAIRLPDFKLVTLAWSPDGATLATSQARQRFTATMMNSGVPPADLRLWDMPGFTIRKVIPGSDPRYAWSALAFSPDSTLLAGVHQAGGMRLAGTTGDSDPAVIWDAHSGTIKQSLDGHFAGPQALAFAPQGTLLALGDHNTFDIYDPPAFTLRPNVAPNAGGFTALAFTRDGKTLITGSEYGRIRFWPLAGTDQERRNGRYAKDPKTGSPAGDAAILALSVSPDGGTVASASGDGPVRLWTIATGLLTTTLTGHEGRVTAVQFAPGGLLFSGGADGTIRVWDPKVGILRATLALLPSMDAPPPVTLVGAPVPDPDGTNPAPPVASTANWISWTPAGFYMASSGAAPFVDWRLGERSLTASERRTTWNQPAQLQAALATGK